MLRYLVRAFAILIVQFNAPATLKQVIPEESEPVKPVEDRGGLD
jgi:hypothetical protein